MNREAVAAYVNRVRAEHETHFLIPRFFVSREEWNRLADHEVYRRHGVLRELQPDLTKILQHQRVVILGEPGAGKSVVAAAAVLELTNAPASTVVPIFANLKSYRGNLSHLLLAAAPPEIIAARDIDGFPVTRAYVLDGLDEVPLELVHRATEEIESVLREDHGSRLVLTSRQAFYLDRPKLWTDPPLEFNLLDFDYDDVRAFAEHRGVNFDAFIRDVRRVDFEAGISNPFTLSVAIAYFQEHKDLPALRSDILAYVIDTTIASRPAVNRFQQRRALRMLAVAMETYSRNELAPDEAAAILTEAMPLPAEKVTDILDELSKVILIRTPNGVAFPMRSFGEYLAAEELGTAPIDRVLELAFIDRTQILNDSWENAISYLAEINPFVRAYFVRARPIWLLSSSPVAFSAAERESVVANTLAEFDKTEQALVGHPIINAWKLARFVTANQATQLLIPDLESGSDHRLANALLLLGYLNRPEALATSVELATDRSRGDTVRYSAIVAISNAGDAAQVPPLVAALNPEDPLSINLADCIGSLANETNLASILPILIGTNSALSLTYQRMRDLRTREALSVVLDFLTDSPRYVNAGRAEMYLKPILRLIPRYWDDGIAHKLASLLVAVELAGTYEERSGLLPVIASTISSRDRDGRVAELVLSTLLERGLPLTYLRRTVASLMSPDTAHWLGSQKATRLIDSLSVYVQGEVRQALAPFTGSVIQAQDEYAGRYRAEEHQRQQAAEALIADQQRNISSSREFGAVIRELIDLKAEHWPELQAGQREWLHLQIAERLVDLDLERRIVWFNDNQFSQPFELPILLAVINHYRFRLENEIPLVDSLVGWGENSVSEYYQRYGLSIPARLHFDARFASRALPRPAISHFLSFLQQTDYCSDAVLTALSLLIFDEQTEPNVRGSAVRLLGQKKAPPELLRAVARTCEQGIAEIALDILVEWQHRPTIEARLSSLLSMADEALRTCEPELYGEGTAAWVGAVQSEFAWPKLSKLRRRSLQLGLPRLVALVSATMARIDRGRLVRLIRRQIRWAPTAWRETQRRLALQHERDARLEAARATPFESVIAKLRRTTTMKRLTVWCEGPTDAPVFRTLLGQIWDSRMSDVDVDDVGGWANFMSESRDPHRYLRGCNQAVVIMDGDNGRELKERGKPFSQLAQDAKRKLEPIGIPLEVLGRYGIENYFSQRACEALMGKDLNGCFPIPDDVSVKDHFASCGSGVGFSKDWNGSIAEQMSAQEIQGTDLEGVLKRLATVARALGRE
jgi:hypothetical protein